MKIEIRLTDKTESYIIKNLYPLYLYDLSGHYNRLPNIHGIYEETDDFQTLSDQYEVQNIWWEKPGILFPYLIETYVEKMVTRLMGTSLFSDFLI